MARRSSEVSLNSTPEKEMFDESIGKAEMPNDSKSEKLNEKAELIEEVEKKIEHDIDELEKNINDQWEKIEI